MIKSSLKRKTPLKIYKLNSLKKTPLNKKSNKQKLRDKEWAKVKALRIELLIKKYGYLPDEFSGEDITNEYLIDGHHNDKNRLNNTLDNCRILKRLSHTFVTDNNIKDVKDWLK